MYKEKALTKKNEKIQYDRKDVSTMNILFRRCIKVKNT